jgi:hypothetical protein
VPILVIATAGASAYYARQDFRLQKSSSARSTVSIANPPGRKGDNCTPVLQESTTEMSGSARLLKDEQLWVLIQAPVQGRFYITHGPVDVSIDHTWSQPLKYIGGDNDQGQVFLLVAVTANLNAGNALARTFYTSKDASLANLPAGASAAAQVCVRRID